MLTEFDDQGHHWKYIGKAEYSGNMIRFTPGLADEIKGVVSGPYLLISGLLGGNGIVSQAYYEEFIAKLDSLNDFKQKRMLMRYFTANAFHFEDIHDEMEFPDGAECFKEVCFDDGEILVFHVMSKNSERPWIILIGKKEFEIKELEIKDRSK